MADDITNTGENLKNRYFDTGETYVGGGGGLSQDQKMTKINGHLQLGMGVNAPFLDVATPCSFIPATIVVTSVPAMYMNNGAPTVMGYLIKNLLESHAKSVSGIDFGYTLNVDSNANAGHDSQQFAVPLKTTRSQVNPSFSFTELSGNLVWNCFKRWIWDINHPDTNASMAQLSYDGPYTMSAYAASFMVIQFDPTMRPDRIIDAAHFCNVFPTETGTIGFERNIGQAKVPERSINFQAIVQHNDQTKLIGMEIAEKLKLHVHNYDAMPPHRSSIDTALNDFGIGVEVKDRSLQANRSPVSATANSLGAYEAKPSNT